MSYKPNSTLCIGIGQSLSGNHNIPIMTSNSYSLNSGSDGVTYFTAGKFKNLKCRIGINTKTASSTIRIQKNGTDQNSIITVPAATTGDFEDLINEDTVSVNDDMRYRVIPGGTGNIRVDFIWVDFYTGGKVVNKIGNYISSSLSTASVTRYISVIGNGNFVASTHLSSYSVSTNVPATWRNLSIEVTANARTTNTTFNFRPNPSTAGNQTIVVPGASTGVFTDTINTDTNVSAPAISFQTLAGTQTITWRTVSLEVESDTYDYNAFIRGQTSWTFNGTRFVSIFGTTEISSIESDRVVRMTSAGQISNLRFWSNPNTRTGATTIMLRKNGQDTDLFVTVPASTINGINNNVDRVYYDVGDELCWRVTTTGTGGITATHITARFRQNSGKIPSISIV